MLIAILTCGLLVVATTVLHYEVLRGLSVGLPALRMPNRAKLVAVILAAFMSHAVQMALYGLAIYALVFWFGAGSLVGTAALSLEACMYFSAETYTSLGFGDLTPTGPVRLLAGAEALNGLLLIGWSASFTYIAMERFWTAASDQPDRRPDQAAHDGSEPSTIARPGVEMTTMANAPRTAMAPRTRRMLQAVLYEVFAIAFVGPVLSLAFGQPLSATLGLAVVLSSIALLWNYGFNALFERWESRQTVKGRSWARRLAHGIGFEGGLTVLLIPVMSLWLHISPWAALLANLGLLAFFFGYAIVFTWAFDRVFGLPGSAVQHTGH